MSRRILSSLIATLLWQASPAALAIPLNLADSPQLDLALSAPASTDSALLSEAVDLLKRGDANQAKAKLAQFLKASPNDPRGPELAGMILMAEKNYPIAAVSFQRAISLNPGNAGAHAKLGVTLLLMNKQADGEAALNRAIALRSGEPLARRYLGWLDESRGNLNGAGHHYVAALTGGLLPAGALTDVHLALGRVYNSLGRFDQTVRLLAPFASTPNTGANGQNAKTILALAYLELQRNDQAAPLLRSLEKSLKPDHPELRYLQAYELLATKPAAAREKLQGLIAAHPGYTGRARLMIARSHIAEGKPALAAKELESLASQVDKEGLPHVLTALVSAYLSAGKPAEAVRVLDHYARQHPGNIEISYLLAETKVHSGDLSGAQAILKQLQVAHPGFARAFALSGQIARSQNALPQAESMLLKATSLDSNLAPAWINLAGVYVARQDLPKAEATLKKALSTNPGNALLQYELASVYDAMGRIPDANKLYEEILKAYPTYLPALNNIALNLAEQGNALASAKQYAERAYQLDPRNPAVLDTYGWILVLDNHSAKGLPMLEQAARAMPKDPVVSYHLGVALVKAGKADEGKRYLQRAMSAGLPESLRKKAQAYLN